eukprot:5545865-Karenia_brevis.AAC.1
MGGTIKGSKPIRALSSDKGIKSFTSSKPKGTQSIKINRVRSTKWHSKGPDHGGKGCGNVE